MKQDRNIEWVLIKRVILIALMITVFSLFIPSLKVSFIKGLWFGSIFTILRMKLIHLSLQKAVKKQSDKLYGYIMLQYSIRYLLTGFVLFLAMKDPTINSLGTIIGLLLLKPAALLDSFPQFSIK